MLVRPENRPVLRHYIFNFSFLDTAYGNQGIGSWPGTFKPLENRGMPWRRSRTMRLAERNPGWITRVMNERRGTWSVLLAKIFQQTSFVVFALFENGWGHTGDFFELAGKVSNAAVVHFKGNVGQR